jgi:hypothetical protein
MKLLYTILIIVVSIYVVIGQDASKFSEAELDREDQDFEPLARGHVAAKHSAQQLSTSKFISPQRFKEESEGLVAACHKMYWTPMTATDKPASFFDSMVAGSVAGSEKYIYAVDIQTDGSKVQRLNVETKKWTTITTTGAPVPKNTVGAAGTSNSKGKIFFFGGKVEGDTLSYNNELKVIQLKDEEAEWTPVVVTGEKPQGRQGATLTPMITKENEFFLFGGLSDVNIEGTTFKLIPSNGGYTWKKITVGAEDALKPSGRTGHSVSAWKEDGKLEKMVLFGGCDNENTCSNDVWIFKTEEDKWEKFEVTGNTLPKKRSRHGAFVRDDKLYVFGGLEGGQKDKPLTDFYVLNLKDSGNKEWKEIAASDYGNTKRGYTTGDTPGYGGGSMVYLKEKDTNVFVQAKDAAVETLRMHGVCQQDCKNDATVSEDGKCKCTTKFQGKYCTTEKPTVSPTSSGTCPHGCNGNGECKDGKCVCNSKFSGNDCAIKKCTDNCNAHGSCKNGTCVCDKQHHGEFCEKTFCVDNCNGHGTCNSQIGRCNCQKGFGGVGCKKSNLCPNECSNNGNCTVTKATAAKYSTSKCECYPGFIKKNCSVDTRCSAGDGSICTGHGKCSNTKCVCDAEWAGLQCELKGCPENCNNNGECDHNLGQCKCNAGFRGKTCATAVKCINNCTNHGSCVYDIENVNGMPKFDGVCKCHAGFSGADCSEMQCPLGLPNQFAKSEEECSGDIHGDCNSKTGVCSCKPGFGGFACEFSCPSGTPSHSGRITDDQGKGTPTEGALWNNGSRPTIGLGHGACSGHGLCVTSADGKARCQCEEGLSGPACDQEQQCEKGCSGHGRCFRGECVCEIGYRGSLCEEKITCPVSVKGDLCSGHGKCQFGKCFCDVGYRQEDCNERILCRDDCNGHGICHDTKCFCAVGYKGSACEIQQACPNKCSGHGRCFLDECKCEKGYTGSDCGKEDKQLLVEIKADGKCMGDCSGQGECRLGKCFCLPSFKGEDCSVPVDYECPGGAAKAKCSGKGVCKYNKCFCMPGYTGEDCAAEAKCPKDCSGNGICKNGRCYCRPPFRGFDCNQTDACPNGCSERGICMKGKCMCIEGFGGKDCSEVTGNSELCPDECSGHGSCALGKCFCDPGWGGKGCNFKKRITCPENCNQQGLCHNDGKCYCNPGLGGRDCSTPMPCPEGCTLHGICKYGRCFCQPGYSGLNCSVPINAEARADAAIAKSKYKLAKVCPNQCSHNGFCLEGKCLCQPGYDGVDCSRVIIGNDDCPNDCGGKESPRGLCWLGKCFCFPGFSGADCMESVKLPCSGECSERGQCHFGKCFCDVGYIGEACETEVKSCPDSCMGRGQCTRGRCVCEIGYRGHNCNTTVGGEYKCLNNCAGNGACIMGTCQCNPGFMGQDCSIAVQDLHKMGVKKNAIVSDQDAVLSTVHNPDHIQQTDVTLADPDYLGTPKDMVVTTGNNTKDKEHFPVAPQKIDGKAEPVIAPTNKKKAGHNNKNVGSRQQAMRMMFVEENEDVLNSKCNGNGIEKANKCYCYPGFSGEFCDDKLECPGQCSNKGICSRGQCFCNPGFTSSDCSIATAVNSTNKHKNSNSNEDQKSCPNDCNFKGLCKGGVCWCKDGFTGPSCETQVDLSIEASAMNAQTERSKILASAASLPMNIVCIIGFGSFVIGLVGAMVWRKKVEARNRDNMKTSVSNSYMKVPLFQQQ